MDVTLVPRTLDAVLARVEHMEPDARAQLSPAWLAQLRSPDVDVWTLGFDIVDERTGVRVGECGFKGRPDADGMVELAYGVSPSHQGKGFATAAARALVTYALRDTRVRVVRAQTLPAANASTRVLTKCGFRHVGDVIDLEDGLVWRWEYDSASS
jgi:RimJ/RimL family protein N-acetyltransferase